MAPPPQLRVGVAMAFLLATLVTLAMAWPVVRAPTRMIFGNEIVGRHHDAYTVMLQMASFGTSGVYAQPLTDKAGWLFARVMDPVAAYNLLILMTFPLSAAAAYALARYLFGSHTGALVAGLAFAFAPFHLAHAAYHPHIAQTQWLPLYFLALFATIDRPSWARAFGLAAATAALVLSNDYAGLIGGVITPVALVVYWWTSPRAGRRWRRLVLPAATLVAIAGAGLAILWWQAPQLFTHTSAVAFPLTDVPKYSARWWSYFVPPVDHPVLGATSAALFAQAEIGHALLEQQLYLGVALLLLAGIGAVAAVTRWRSEPSLRPLLALVVIAFVAAAISVGPLSGYCIRGSWAPACRLYQVAPMFRAYARFGVVAELGVALAASAAAMWLIRRSRGAATAAVTLLLLAAFEFAPVPARAHDVLPTAGHRWLAGQAPAQRTLDCLRATPAESYLSWLMKRNVSFLNPEVRTCTDPDLADRLAALGYSHVIVRRTADASELAGEPAGLALLADLPDSRVYIVAVDAPPVVTMRTIGFDNYEHDAGDWWRWMSPEGRWTVRNTTPEPKRVSLQAVLEAEAFPRRLTLTLDGQPAGVVDVGGPIRQYTIGTWTLAPGDHALAFAASGGPAPDSPPALPGDRVISVSFRQVRWIVH